MKIIKLKNGTGLDVLKIVKITNRMAWFFRKRPWVLILVNQIKVRVSDEELNWLFDSYTTINPSTTWDR
jgi:hypothetical protein